jgi:hypothetical protein
MNEILKYLTIANLVGQIIQNFLNAGGPSVNPLIVANEVSKELERRVANGFLPSDILDDHESIIQAAIDYHPSIPNIKPALTR